MITVNLFQDLRISTYWDVLHPQKCSETQIGGDRP